MPNFTAFISYVFVTTFTPGPNNIMSMSNASRYGLKKSLGFNYGVSVGFFIILMLSNIFSYSLYKLIPTIKPFMTVIGASYIFYLAWKTFKSKPHKNIEESKRTNTFSKGLLLQFVNPKGIIYGITLASTFIVPYYKSIPTLVFFALALSTIALMSTVTWALFGSVFQKFMEKNYRIINTIMAGLLLYSGVSLFI
ncbi:MAG: LysE family transporter [Tissierellia bacterium]|nr:LysE family transporter [Tissierellia bacterium]